MSRETNVSLRETVDAPRQASEPAAPPHEPRGAKLRALRMAAVLVSAFGLAAFSFGWHNSTIRFLGYGALIAMPFLFKAIAVRGRRAEGGGSINQELPKRTGRFDRLMRTICIVLVPLASLVVWPYLFARAFGRWLKH